MDLYLERQKNKLKGAVESGMLNEQQRMAAIDDTIDNILIYLKDNNAIQGVVKKFDDKNEELTNEMINLQKKITDNYNKIYKHLIEDEFTDG